MTPYVTNLEFKQYVDAFVIDTDDFDVADSSKRTKALTVATRAIDRLNFQGDKAVPGQQNQFPRGSDSVVPTAIKNATCELALTYLAGKNLDQKFDDQAVVHEAFMGVKTSYDTGFVQEHLINGIISYEAWLLIRPYLTPMVIEILHG